jgi:hypothetical protein
MAGISPDQLARELTKSLTEYGKLAQHEVHDILESVGEEARDRVTDASPKGKRRGSGKYQRGWKVKIEESGSRVSVTVHNRRYQLTHLLEFGHRTRLKHGKYGKQSFAGAQPHIADANAWAQRELERRIRKALGG